MLTRLALPVDAPLDSLPAIGFIFAAQPDIDALLVDALEALGIAANSVTLPLLGEAHRAGLTIINRENWLAFNALLASHAVSPDVASRIQAGESITSDQLASAENVRVQFTGQVNALLEDTPLLALATLPELPPTLEEAEDPLSVVNLTRLVRPFNLSGHPAISLPMGELQGRPVALQLVAGFGEEGLLVQAAEWLMLHRL